MLIDDILSLQPGTAGTDGPTTVVGINVYGSFVVTNTAHNGVGNFYNASDIQVSAAALVVLTLNAIPWPLSVRGFFFAYRAFCAMYNLLE